jgi:hypothetical protein
MSCFLGARWLRSAQVSVHKGNNGGEWTAVTTDVGLLRVVHACSCWDCHGCVVVGVWDARCCGGVLALLFLLGGGGSLWSVKIGLVSPNTLWKLSEATRARPMFRAFL